MLVKSAILIIYINDKYTFAVPIFNVVRQIHVYVVAIYTLRASYVAIGVVHRDAPLLAVAVNATAHTAFRVLDGYIIAVYLDVPFLVIASFFLRFGRVLFDFRFLLCNFLANSLLVCGSLRIFAFRRSELWRYKGSILHVRYALVSNGSVSLA